jgi:hypothetical protein
MAGLVRGGAGGNPSACPTSGAAEAAASSTQTTLSAAEAVKDVLPTPRVIVGLAPRSASRSAAPPLLRRPFG